MNFFLIFQNKFSWSRRMPAPHSDEGDVRGVWRRPARWCNLETWCSHSSHGAFCTRVKGRLNVFYIKIMKNKYLYYSYTWPTWKKYYFQTKNIVKIKIYRFQRNWHKSSERKMLTDYWKIVNWFYLWTWIKHLYILLMIIYPII